MMIEVSENEIILIDQSADIALKYGGKKNHEASGMLFDLVERWKKQYEKENNNVTELKEIKK
jgi:hypothetical protein